MKTEINRSGQSALKKLIPACAMLMTSAVMLSTATYAWFTMNKEVQLTGLNMSATAGEGIEIALASVVKNEQSEKVITFSGATYFEGHPSDEDTEEGWRSAVSVRNFYSDIGKLRPASSVDAISLFYATDASNKGMEASTFKQVTIDDDMAGYTTKTTFVADQADALTSNSDPGYYIDIPVHIRTSKPKINEQYNGAEPINPNEFGKIYCRMIINDNNENADDKLYKAVRVAFIPSAANNNSTTIIFGSNNEYYQEGKAVRGEGGQDNPDPRSAVSVETGSISDTTEFKEDAGVFSGLYIPYAENVGEYGHLDFTMRVWLEGESKYCYDENAGQEWNISVAFSLGEFEVDNTPPQTP